MTPTFIGYFAKRIVKRDREGSRESVGGFPVSPPVDEICISKPEPGPYCVVEVWRKGKDAV